MSGATQNILAIAIAGWLCTRNSGSSLLRNFTIQYNSSILQVLCTTIIDSKILCMHTYYVCQIIFCKLLSNSALYVDHDVYRFLKPRKCSVPIHNLQIMRINEITYSFTFSTFPHSLPLKM